MPTDKTGSWIRNNLASIMVPLASGAIALFISYGASVQDDTQTKNRIVALEKLVIELGEQDEEFDDDFDDLEDMVSSKTRELENMVTREGRDIERTVIRMESRLDSIARRMALFDGIGAPSMLVAPPPSFNFESLELQEFENDQ
jgi:hypothetical protein